MQHTENNTLNNTNNEQDMETKKIQQFIRKSWRNYTKTNPKSQTSQELFIYHFLRFGHGDKCFTKISNTNKINCNYNGNALFTAEEEKRRLEYSLRMYSKSSLDFPKEFMAHIWGKEFIAQQIIELTQRVEAWKPSAREPNLVEKKVALKS